MSIKSQDDFMEKTLVFIITVIKRVKNNDLISMANALTYKLVISIFPFIIFLMTIIGFLNINPNNFLKGIEQEFPSDIMNIINAFMKEVIYTKRLSLLSSSLFISIVSASSGFNSMIRGLNKAYEIKETRNYIKVRLISILLVVVFAGLMIASLMLFIFSDAVKKLIVEYSILTDIPKFIDGFTMYFLNFFILCVIIVIIYKIAICRKISSNKLIPGAAFSAVSWLILSKGFNIYVNNFSRFSKVYGSIGSVFILLFWINMISFILLIGGQINAVLYDRNK